MVFELELLGLRAALALGVVVAVFALGLRLGLASGRGWNLLVLGLAVVGLGFVLDAAALVPELAGAGLVGERVEAELVRLIVIVGGFALLGAGFATWLPGVAEALAERRALRAEEAGLQARVREEGAALAEAGRTLAASAGERAATEQALREAQARFQELAAVLPEVVYLAEPGPAEPAPPEKAAGPARFLYLSPSAAALMGLRPEEAYRDPGSWLRAFHPADRAAAAETWSRPPGPYAQRLRVQRPDGAVRWVEDHGAAVPDARGQVARVTGVLVDVTAQVEAETALRRSEARFRALAERLPDALLTLAEDGAVRAASPGMARFGHDPASFPRGPGWLLAATHPEDRERIAADLAAAFRGGGVLDAEFRLLRRDGTAAWVRLLGAPVHGGGSEGAARELDACLVDLTETREAKQELWAHDHRLRAFAGALPVAFWMVDLQRRHVLAASPGFEALFGGSRAFLAEDPHAWLAEVAPEDQPAARAALATPGGATVQVRLKADRAGPASVVRLHLVDLRDGKGRPWVAGGVAVEVAPPEAREGREGREGREAERGSSSPAWSSS